MIKSELQPWAAVSTFLVSSARCSKLWSNQLVDWSSIYPLNAVGRWWPQMKLKSKSLPIGQCHMQNAWQLRDNRKNPEYHVVAAIRKLRTDTNYPAGESWPNHVKNGQHIGSEKIYGPQNSGQFSIKMKRTANENTACLYFWVVLCLCVKRIFAWNHSYENALACRPIFSQIELTFNSYEKFCTRTCFETEAEDFTIKGIFCGRGRHLLAQAAAFSWYLRKFESKTYRYFRFLALLNV